MPGVKGRTFLAVAHLLGVVDGDEEGSAELRERQRPAYVSVPCDGTRSPACLAVPWEQLGRETGKVHIALMADA